MTKPASDKPVRRSSIFTPYRIVWSMLGTFGLGYLGVAIFAPDVLGELTPAIARGDRFRADTEAAMVKLSADVNGVRSSMAKLQLDVAGLKSDVATQASQTQSLNTQVSELQDKMRPPQTPVAATTNGPAPGDEVTTTASVVEFAAPGTPDAGNAAPADAASGDTVSNDAAPRAAKIINAAPAAPKPLITGSVDTPSKPKNAGASSEVISFGPAVVKPATKPIGLVIGSDASVDALRLSWSMLSESHADKLKKFKARVAENGDFKNPNFNLIAGPVKTKAEAIRICKDLQAQQVTCKVGEFKGEEL